MSSSRWHHHDDDDDDNHHYQYHRHHHHFRNNDDQNPGGTVVHRSHGDEDGQMKTATKKPRVSMGPDDFGTATVTGVASANHRNQNSSSSSNNNNSNDSHRNDVTFIIRNPYIRSHSQSNGNSNSHVDTGRNADTTTTQNHHHHNHHHHNHPEYNHHYQHQNYPEHHHNDNNVLKNANGDKDDGPCKEGKKHYDDDDNHDDDDDVDDDHDDDDDDDADEEECKAIGLSLTQDVIEFNDLDWEGIDNFEYDDQNMGVSSLSSAASANSNHLPNDKVDGSLADHENQDDDDNNNGVRKRMKQSTLSSFLVSTTGGLKTPWKLQPRRDIREIDGVLYLNDKIFAPGSYWKVVCDSGGGGGNEGEGGGSSGRSSSSSHRVEKKYKPLHNVIVKYLGYKDRSNGRMAVVETETFYIESKYCEFSEFSFSEYGQKLVQDHGFPEILEYELNLTINGEKRKSNTVEIPLKYLTEHIDDSRLKLITNWIYGKSNKDNEGTYIKRRTIDPNIELPDLDNGIPTVIDLYAGSGGMSKGLHQANFVTVACG